jgi:hypothetical protein
VNLSKREMNLVIITAALGGVLAIIALWSVVRWTLAGPDQDPALLEQQLDEQRFVLDRLQTKADRLTDLRRRSLPSDPLRAETDYLHWLWELGEARLANFKETSPTTVRPYKKKYQELTINVSGHGSLSDLIEFLYAFHRAGHVHRIRRLTIKPASDSSDLTFTFLIQALSLPDADRSDKLFDIAKCPEDQRPRLLAYDELPAYDTILERSLFQPYVEPPDLASLLAGISSGALSQGARAAAPKPPAPKPPPKPEYRPPVDIARYTYVTAIIRRNLVPQVWLHVRLTDDKPKLGEGQTFEVGNRQLGTLKGKILRIGVDQVLVEMADGRRLVVGHGENFGEAREVGAPAAVGSVGPANPADKSSEG